MASIPSTAEVQAQLARLQTRGIDPARDWAGNEWLRDQFADFTAFLAFCEREISKGEAANKLAESVAATLGGRLQARGVEPPSGAEQVIRFRVGDFLDRLEAEIVQAQARRAEGQEFAGSGAGMVMQAPGDKTEGQ